MDEEGNYKERTNHIKWAAEKGMDQMLVGDAIRKDLGLDQENPRTNWGDNCLQWR